MKFSLFFAASSAIFTAAAPLPNITLTASTTPSTLAARKDVNDMFPPPGGWSPRTECVIHYANKGYIMVEIQHRCRMLRDQDGKNNYHWCMQQANEEKVSSDDAFVRCDRLKDFDS